MQFIPDFNVNYCNMFLNIDDAFAQLKKVKTTLGEDCRHVMTAIECHGIDD